MIENGFFPLPFDPCVLQNELGEIYIVWVDDIIVIAPNMARIKHMKEILSYAYEIRNLGELSDYLGLAITHDRKTHTMYIN